MLLDVRNHWEFKRDHLPDSINIPHQKIVGDITPMLNQLPKTDTLVVYCETGVRSRIAQRFLQKHGYEKVLRLEGDISQWRNAKLPLDKKG